MRVKYVPFFTENMEATVSFFTEKLKFSEAEHASVKPNAGFRLMHKAPGDVAIALTGSREYRSSQNQLILHTADCLNDYHQLKGQHVQFTKEPHYTPAGLMAEFTDGFANHFVLLEERNYNTDL